MRLRFAQLLLVCIYCAGGQAATWNTLASDDKRMFFFDSDTVVKRGATVSVWIREVLNPVSVVPGGASYSMTRYVLDCSKRTYRISQGRFYTAGGEPLAQVKPEGPIEAAPDTYAQLFVKVGCEPTFPNDKHSKDYKPIVDREVGTVSALYFALINQPRAPKIEQLQGTDELPPARSFGRWYAVVEPSASDLVFIQSVGMVRNGKSVTAWVTVAGDEGSGDEVSVSSSAFRLELDCVGWTSRVLRVVPFERAGKISGPYSRSPEATAFMAERGTLGDRVLQVACRPEFPSSESSANYVAVGDEDIYDYAKRQFRMKRQDMRAKQ